MKKEIKGKEYNIKKITWGDINEFGDFLTKEKLKVMAQHGKDAELDNAPLNTELQAILKQVGLTTNINIDVLKNLEIQLKRIQSTHNSIIEILATPITFEEIILNMRSIKGMMFIIWLAIRDNGIKYSDMDSIIDFDNAVEIFEFIEIIGLKRPDSDVKNELAEVEKPSPSE